jgi:hypothetical protein
MAIFGPLNGYDKNSLLKVVDEDRNVETYYSDYSGAFLIPKDSEGKYALLDSNYYGVMIEGVITEGNGKFTLTDMVNASASPEVESITLNGRRVEIEFSQVMRKDTGDFDVDTDGLEGSFHWSGKALYFNITGGYAEESKEVFTFKVLSTATSMWGVGIKEEASIDIDRKDLVVEKEDEDDDDGTNTIVWIVAVILVVLFLSIIVLYVLSRKSGGIDKEEDWEE